MADSVSVSPAAVEGEDDDLDHLFYSIPEDFAMITDLFQQGPLSESHLSPSDLSPESTAPHAFSNPSHDSVSSWIDEVEHLLMKEDDDDDQVFVDSNSEFCTDFLSDILLDSPAETPSPDHLEASTDKDSAASLDGQRQEEEEEKINASNPNTDDDDNNRNNNSSSSNGEDEDPVSKKRTRQLRNRDAAVRSRERKKIYVKDLEMKSRYLEGECRRLGRLLQCCFAENQSLRFQLLTANKGFGASTSKQESAVLFLESLLLGSLLWLLSIICLFPLARLAESTLEATPRGSVNARVLENVATRRAGSKIIPSSRSLSLSRGCRASRTKMKMITLGFEVLG